MQRAMVGQLPVKQALRRKKSVPLQALRGIVNAN